MLKAKALYLLSRREYSRRELHLKLRQKGFPAQAIDNLLNELEQENLLNDDRFISSLIRMRRNRGAGPLKVLAECQKHGFSRRQIQSNEEWQEELWHAIARSARIKRFGTAIPLEAQEIARQTRFLQQRGFTSEQIRAAFAE